MLRYPILGGGAGMFRDRSQEFGRGYVRHGQEAHNIFIKVGAELGIGGLVFFIMLLYYSIRDVWEVHRGAKKVNPLSWEALQSLALTISLLVYIMAGMFLVIPYSVPPYLLMGLCVAMRRVVGHQPAIVEDSAAWETPRGERLRLKSYRPEPRRNLMFE